MIAIGGIPQKTCLWMWWRQLVWLLAWQLPLLPLCGLEGGKKKKRTKKKEREETTKVLYYHLINQPVMLMIAKRNANVNENFAMVIWWCDKMWCDIVYTRNSGLNIYLLISSVLKNKNPWGGTLVATDHGEPDIQCESHWGPRKESKALAGPYWYSSRARCTSGCSPASNRGDGRPVKWQKFRFRSFIGRAFSAWNRSCYQMSHTINHEEDTCRNWMVCYCYGKISLFIIQILKIKY
jgi:hypothetical protein